MANAGEAMELWIERAKQSGHLIARGKVAAPFSPALETAGSGHAAGAHPGWFPLLLHRLGAV